MAIAFDADSHSGAETADYNWPHTPVGTPRGVVVIIVQSGTEADEVNAVTYGGVPMTEIALSPFTYTVSNKPIGAIHGFFLGSDIPTGEQSIAVDMSAGAADTQQAVAWSVTADDDTEVVDTTTFESEVETTPSITLAVPAGVEAFIAGTIHSGNNMDANIVPGADYTETWARDFGTNSAKFARRTENTSGGDTVMDWSFSGGLDNQNALFGAAIRETGAPSPTEGILPAWRIPETLAALDIPRPPGTPVPRPGAIRV